MTDAHCHVPRGESRHFLCGREPIAVGGRDVAFMGLHPWEAEGVDIAAYCEQLRTALAANPRLGVGEIGLDRLKCRDISATMRLAFEEQLKIAAEFRRPVVLHGAKCWGQVVKACEAYAGKIPAFLFHGFSRSDGLLPDIYKLNGYISIGPQLLNDHAVNYRALAKKIDRDRLLVESDRTPERANDTPSVVEVLKTLSAILEIDQDALISRIEENADRFAYPVAIGV